MRDPPSHVDEDHGAPDHWHVDLGERWEITFWTHLLDCSEAQLREAVASVGTRAGDVRAYLHRHHAAVM